MRKEVKRAINSVLKSNQKLAARDIVKGNEREYKEKINEQRNHHPKKGSK